jgi:membrane protein YdbS with pleckstrin-like domain
MSSSQLPREESDDGLGAKFWLSLIGVTLAAAIGVALIFLFFGAVWYAWGLVGAIVALVALVYVVGWVMDRRARSRWT